MFIADFEWDEYNIAHIARHNVFPDEAEQVFESYCYTRKTFENKYLAWGQASSGRYLFVVYSKKSANRIRIITARDMDKRDEKFYRRRRGGRLK